MKVNLHIEQFWTLYLNNSNKVLSKLKISEGGMTGTVVDIRLILKHALELNATSIVLSQPSFGYFETKRS